MSTSIVLRELEKAMVAYASRYFYDDFLYLSIVIDCIETGNSLKKVNYLDTSLLDKNGGGDCTQLSNHFGQNIVSPMSLEWNWLVSTDNEYSSSHKALLIPFRSTAIMVSTPNESDSAYYLGVPLGHHRPIPIRDGAQDVFWNKSYRIETLSSARFRLYTTGRKINRYREYFQPDLIDFQSAWTNMVFVKDIYSIVSYGSGVRHYLGYNIFEDRVYYTLRTERVRSKPLPKFLSELEANLDQFSIQLSSKEILPRLRKVQEYKHRLRQMIERGP